MKYYFKQRLFSWLDSYDIYNEYNETEYTVQGVFSLGHCLHVYNSSDEHIGTIKEELFRLLPHFQIFYRDQYVGEIVKEFSFFKPSFNLDFNGWHVEGNWLEWDYTIVDLNGNPVATVNKDVWNLTDVYWIDVENDEDALDVLMVVLAIDAEKCSRN